MNKVNEFLLDFLFTIVSVCCIVILFTFGLASFLYGSILVAVACAYYYHFRDVDHIDILGCIVAFVVSNLVLFTALAFVTHGNDKYIVNIAEDNNYSIVGFTDKSVVVNTDDGMRTFGLNTKELYKLSSKYRDTNGTLNVVLCEYWFSNKAVGYGIYDRQFKIIKDK